VTAEQNDAYEARLTVEYPDRDMDRLSTALRLLYIIPIGIVLALPLPGCWRCPSY
jgi:hypothetical protein